MSKQNLYTRLLIMLAIIVSLAFISTQFTFRLDFTGDQRYTLSNATLDILNDLEQVVTVKAYFSKDLPPNIASVKTDFKDLLIEYERRSGGKIAYEFIDPSKSEEAEQEAMQAGIQPVMINVRDKDQVKQQKAYLGAKLIHTNNEEILPFIQPGAAMEYALSSSIKKLSIPEKPKIGLITGHGAAGRQSMQQAVSVLEDLYHLSEIDLRNVEQLENFESLIIVAPENPFSEEELKILESQVKNGTGLLLAINTVEGDFSTNRGKAVETGLADWLKQTGIELKQEFALDINCGSVSVQQQQGFFTYNTPIQFPYLPLIRKFPDHPITKGLENIVFSFASPIKLSLSDSTIHADVLLRTSTKSATEPTSTYFDIRKQWRDSDFDQSELILGIAAEGNFFGSSKKSKLVLFGDGDFPVNGLGQQARELNKDNVSLFVNAVEWLSDDTGLNELRTKGRNSRPITAELEDRDRNIIKYANFITPLFLVIIYGLIRAWLRKRKRNRLKETKMS